MTRRPKGREGQEANGSAKTRRSGKGDRDVSNATRRTGIDLAGWPPTIGAAAILATTSTEFLLTHQVSASSIGVLVAIGVVSVAAWVGLATRSGGFAHYCYERHRKRTAGAEPDLDALAQGLARAGGQQAAEQLALLARKMDTVRAVLLKRLDEGEITFQRYLLTAEQVYLAGLDNLREIEVPLTAQSGMDAGYMKRRREALAGADDARSTVEKEAIAQREDRHQALDEKVAGLLAQNEAILSALDAASVSMAQAKIGTRAGATDADTAMEELHRLAGAAKRYERED